MKKIAYFSKLIAGFLTVCMIISIIPVVASAAATVQYVNYDESGDEPTASFSDTPTENTIGVYFNGSLSDTYTLTQDLSDYTVIVNDMELILGSGGNIDKTNIITAGSGHVKEGNVYINTPGLARCDETDVMDMVIYFSSFDSYVTFNINGNTTIDYRIDVPYLIVNSGTLTISAITNFDHVTVKSGASVYIEAPLFGDPNGLNINMGGTLTVENGAQITADEGQILEIGTDGSSSGIDFYEFDGVNINSYTIASEHDPLSFEYHDSKWILPQQNSGQNQSYFIVHARNVYDPQYGGGYIGVTRSSDPDTGERSLNPGFTEEYTAGETLYFHVAPPRDEENVLISYTIVNVADNSRQTYYVNYDNDKGGYYFNIEIDPMYNVDLPIIIAWSQEGYDFDVQYFNSGIRTQISTYGYVAGDTYITTANNTREMTYRGNTKAQFADGTTQIEYHIYPGQRRYLKEISCDAGDLSIETLESGTLPSGYSFSHGTQYDTFIIPTNDPDREYYVGFEFQELPGYEIYFDDSRFDVSASSTDGTTALTPDTIYDYPATGTLTLTFTKTDVDETFYGIIVYYQDETEDQYIKAEDLLNGNQIQITDFSKVVHINVVTWQTPFNSEMQINYDDGAGEVYLDGNLASNRTVFIFQAGNSYSIEFIPDSGSVYKVEKVENGVYESVDITNDLVNNTYTFTPTSNKGVSFNVFWSEEQYRYDNISYQDGETLIMLDCEGEGGVDILCDDEVAQAEYNGTRKFVAGASYTQFTLEFHPNHGTQVEEVWIDGVEYTDQIVDRTLVINRPANTDFIYIYVRISKVDDLFDLDGDGNLSSYDYSMLRDYIECVTDGSNVHMGKADLNHDGSVDGLDVVFFDLYRNGIITFEGETK